MNPYVKSLLLGSFLWYLGAGLFGPLYAVFAERIGGDILELTGAYALYLVTTGLLSIIIGRVIDGHRLKKHLMLAGYALNALGTFGYLVISTPSDLFLVQAVLGVAAALATPTWDALFSMHLDRNRVGFEWGVSAGMPNVVTGIALLVGGLIVAAYGFPTLFVVMGIIQVIATLVQASVYRVSARHHSATTHA